MDLRYPIGPFEWRGENSAEDRRRYLDEIEQAPGNLYAAIRGLSDEQLDTPYRPGGWTVRQVVHHLPDSHLNSYVRFRLALTEDEPTIKPYDESRWAELTDARSAPVEISLAFIESMGEAEENTPRRARTSNLRFRRPMLYPIELWVRWSVKACKQDAEPF